MDLEFDIQHKPGEDNIADYLSRLFIADYLLQIVFFVLKYNHQMESSS
jgi:hypothetical protein